MNIKILRGIPASGKSTWAKEWCESNDDWIRISRDDIRRMRVKYWIPEQENFITELERSLIKTSIENGKNIIIDSTNLNQKFYNSLKDYIISLEDSNINIADKWFHISLEEALRRDEIREHKAGKEVIERMYNTYKSAFEKDDFIEVYENRSIPKLEVITDPQLPPAIIVDIDGTIAERRNRSPFEWNKVDQDLPRQAIIDIVVNYHKLGYKILFLTGREGTPKCRELTIEWIEKYTSLDSDSSVFDLYMRGVRDSRKDSIVKKEIFTQYINGKYNVAFVLDDRDSVIKMWRNELGLDCLQVNYGNF